jgi:serine/threonine-protein kinase
VDLELGSLIQNKYRIVRLIGQGGMGAVYEGENVLIARRVAIKVLYSGIASQHGVVERFEREAQAAGRIGNDHILEVLDMGTLPDGNRFMVMEYLDGETLGDRVERLGRLTAEQVTPLARQLLVGLTAAHRAGIIHRDLKPDNVFILREKAGKQDYVKIIDFGISKFTTLDQDMKMTATGAVMGTPYFMSPEQAKGSRSADVRSDLYAVGVIMYKAITGIVPFDGATFNELLFKIVLSPVPPPRESVPDLDPAFETIIMKAMARDPEFRFQDADEFIAALDGWIRSGSGVTIPPPEASGYNQAEVIGPRLAVGTLAGTNPATMATEAHGAWVEAEAKTKSSSGKGSRTWIGLGVAAGLALLGVVLWAGSGSEAPGATEEAHSGSSAPSVDPAAPEVTGAPEQSPGGPVVSPVSAEPSHSALAVSDLAVPNSAPTGTTAQQGEPEGKPGPTSDSAGSATEEPTKAPPRRPSKRPVKPQEPEQSPQPVKPKPRGNTSPDFGY